MALSQYGVKEIAGKDHNPVVLDYFKAAGHGWVKDDETAWCSAFTCWVAAQCGCEHPGSLLARDWLKVGVPVETPQQGDIVVFWRVTRGSMYGHVAFFISATKASVFGLGGNQSNTVTISAYPSERVLGYRRLNKK